MLRVSLEGLCLRVSHLPACGLPFSQFPLPLILLQYFCRLEGPFPVQKCNCLEEVLWIQSMLVSVWVTQHSECLITGGRSKSEVMLILLLLDFDGR
jgi:hypothetical protein